MPLGSTGAAIPASEVVANERNAASAAFFVVNPERRACLRPPLAGSGARSTTNDHTERHRLDRGCLNQFLDHTLLDRVRLPFGFLGLLSHLNTGRLPRRPMPGDQCPETSAHSESAATYVTLEIHPVTSDTGIIATQRS